MLPEGWKLKQISEIGRVVTGSTPPSATLGLYDGPVPFVTPGDLGIRRDVFKAERSLSEAGMAYARPVPAGSTLVTCIGSTIGKLGFTTVPVATNQQINAVVPHSEHDPDFIYYQLDRLGPIFKILAGTQAVPLLNKSAFSGVQLAVPATRREESCIAEILVTWDTAIAMTEKLLANSRKQKRDLMQVLLSGRRHFPGDKATWKAHDVDRIFERITRKNTAGNQNVLTISGQHGLISQRDYFNKSVASENLQGYTLLARGDFAYNKSYSAGYPLGAIKPLKAYDAGVVSSLYLCFRLRPEAKADADFFRHYFEAGMLNEEISSIAQEGARNHGLLNVSVTDFFKLRLYVPVLKTQRRIAEVINAAEAEELCLIAQLDRLRQEKRSLMHDLLTGKRRVRLPEPVAEPQAA